MAAAIFSNEQLIVMTITENPKRPGTLRHARFQNFFKAATVGEFLKLGGARKDILKNQKLGYLFLDTDNAPGSKQTKAKATKTVKAEATKPVKATKAAAKPVDPAWPFGNGKASDKPAGTKAKRATRKPSKVVVTTPAV